ncbi:MAG: hypothetical protein MRK02_12090 [Candidatus Scalindua sp.]|nr:hypothetical protein [Candidatus Scalindua sp.]
MRIKSFIASTIQEALSKIKSEMGESPIILDTRNINDEDIKGKTGQSLVEIVAAENFAEKVCYKEKDSDSGCDENREINNGEVDNDEESFSFHQETDLLDDEWPETCKEWYSLLCEQQVESRYAKILIGEMLAELEIEELGRKDLQRQKIKEIMVRRIKIFPSCHSKDKTNRTMVFIGATGVGKTTTISKLATETRLSSGNEIVLISIEDDCVEKLNKIARVIGAAVAVVTTPQELRLVKDEFRGSSHIFIETPGVSCKDNSKLLAIKEYMNTIPNSEIHLVLDATTRLKDIHTLIEEPLLFPIHSLLFTKVDEADAYGALLNVVMKSKIPVSYIAGGKGLSEDINPATANTIAEMILN